jgi:hypothetical protein
MAKTKDGTSPMMKRADAVLRLKGPALERARLAIRLGLDEESLRDAMHSINLSRINLGLPVSRDEPEGLNLAGLDEPEGVFFYLASAAERLNAALAGVVEELDSIKARRAA